LTAETIPTYLIKVTMKIAGKENNLLRTKQIRSRSPHSSAAPIIMTPVRFLAALAGGAFSQRLFDGAVFYRRWNRSIAGTAVSDS